MGTMGSFTLITFVAKYVVSMLNASLRVVMYSMLPLILYCNFQCNSYEHKKKRFPL